MCPSIPFLLLSRGLLFLFLFFNYIYKRYNRGSWYRGLLLSIKLLETGFRDSADHTITSFLCRDMKIV
jgi:hypothetical protein